MTTEHQLDVRSAGYGESPFQIFDAVSRLPPGCHLHVLHRMDPWIVNRILLSEGFELHMRFGGEELPVELFIWRADDSAARSRVVAEVGVIEPPNLGNITIEEPAPEALATTPRQTGPGPAVVDLSGLAAARVQALQQEAAHTFGLGTVFRDALNDGSSAPEMAVIPPGTSWLGNITGHGYGLERAAHRETFERPFAIGVHPITVGEFGRFVAATNTVTQAEHGVSEADRQARAKLWEGWKGEGSFTWNHPALADDPRRPATVITWHEANDYCAWLSTQSGHTYRLPSEAEWEYACRAGSEADWCFGSDERELANYAWYGENADGKTHAVGMKQPNALGLHDLHGNIWEWTASTYTYGRLIIKNSCIMRGGCWETRPFFTRASAFCFRNKQTFNNRMGFRVAREL